MVTSIYLVRHGNCDNPQKLLKGRLPGFPLTARGKKDAASAALLIRGKIEAVYTSPLTRTVETAQIIGDAKEAAIIVDERLNEWDLHEREGIPHEKFDKTNDYWIQQNRPTQLHAGELFEDVATRMRAAYVDIVRACEGKKCVIVSHGDPLQALLLSLQHKPLDSKKDERYPRMGEVVLVTVDGREIRVDWLMKE